MSFVKHFKRFTKVANKDTITPVSLDQFQEKLSQEIFRVLNEVFETQQLQSGNSDLTKDSIPKIIESYSKKNQVIAVASSFAPGPLGIMAAAPEMIMTVSNQMKMIYDLGCCFGKENFLSKDLLIDIPLQAAGVSTNLHEIQACSTNPEIPVIEVLEEKALAFAKMSVHKMVKKSVTKWVPVGGSIIMVLWSKMSTNKIATIATDFFDDNKKLTPVKDLDLSAREEQLLLLTRIKILIKLIEADGHIAENEIKFISPIIQNSDLDSSTKEQLMEAALQKHSHLDVDFACFKGKETEIENLIFELGILAKRDSDLKETEKDYIRLVARQLSLDNEMVEKIILE